MFKNLGEALNKYLEIYHPCLEVLHKKLINNNTAFIIEGVENGIHTSFFIDKGDINFVCGTEF